VLQIGMLVLLALFVVSIWAQSPPALSNDFSAEVSYDDHRLRYYRGNWMSDFTGKRDRFDSEIPGVGRVDWWKFWNSTRGGIEYAYDEGRQQCDHRALVEPLQGPFTFLNMSKMTGPCGSGNDLWSYKTHGLIVDVCVTSNGKTPQWVERRELPDFHVRIGFHTYHPGRPSASSFVLPKECK